MSAPEVLVERTSSLGRIRLNRPRALNSLTIGIVRAIASALTAFESDDAVSAVLITGEGERGLCAGGDIRAVYESVRDGTDAAATFWREEYIVNARIARLGKPYVAVMDGITMGGGVGVSAHGSHRIVTERSRIAMPETGIGFFPDVGATWLLNRAPGELGAYLALTGATLDAADAIHSRLADAFVPVAKIDALADALSAAAPGIEPDGITRIIGGFAEDAGRSILAERQEEIDTTFAGDDVEAIVARMSALDTDFGRETAALLAARSPTSLKVTLRLLRLGRQSRSLEECLQREFDACMRVLHTPDLVEGIRAAVIDKDRRPKWSPARLEDVNEADVAEYLVPGAPLFSGRGMREGVECAGR